MSREFMEIRQGREREWKTEQERMLKVVADRLYERMPGANVYSSNEHRHQTPEWKFCMAIAAEIERATLELDDETNEKRWFSVKGMGVLYTHEDRAEENLQAAVKTERDACAAKCREYAEHYPQSSDGRNTFVMLAEWIESRNQ